MAGAKRRRVATMMCRMGLSVEMGDRGAWLSIVCAALVVCAALQGAFAASAFAQAATPVPVHGLWVWKSPTVLEAPGGAEALRDFCKSQGINEVYVSISGQRRRKRKARSRG